MEYTTVSYPSDKTNECNKKHGLTIPYLMHDFRIPIMEGKEPHLKRRIFKFGENPTIQCSIDIDYSGDNLTAEIKYRTSDLPRRPYEVTYNISDISETETDGKEKKYCLEHEICHKNLWLTVVNEWRQLCYFHSILRKNDLLKFIQNDRRFLLMFKFTEGDYVEVRQELKILSSIFENETFADFTIFAQGEEFKVHRAILATISAVFQAMFSSQMQEQQEGKMTINDIEPAIVKEMLRFMYTASVHNIEQNAEKLLIAADKYRLDDLKKVCSSQLGNSINTENVMNILVIADTYNDKMLRESALEFIRKNLKAILNNRNNMDIINNRPDFAIEILMHIA